MAARHDPAATAVRLREGPCTAVSARRAGPSEHGREASVAATAPGSSAGGSTGASGSGSGSQSSTSCTDASPSQRHPSCSSGREAEGPSLPAALGGRAQQLADLAEAASSTAASTSTYTAGHAPSSSSSSARGAGPSAGGGGGGGGGGGASRRFDLASLPADAGAAFASPSSLSTAAAVTGGGPYSFTAGAPGEAGGIGGGGGPAAASASASMGAAAEAGADAAADAALAARLGVSSAEAGVVRLFERHCPSVVAISGMRAMQTFTTLDPAKLPPGQGSGFIWGDRGHVVTCYHLVKGAAEVKVTLHDNTSYTAKVLGYDAAKDVAVLKLSVPKSKLRDLQPVCPGSAAGLRVGQTLYGIGNPWGLGHTLSKGCVCGLGLELSAGLFPIKGVISLDCPPDPGSSGGALLDGRGSLVGMLVTPPASSGGGGGGGGRSFAVPLDAVRGLVQQILTYGRTVRPALGITMAPPQVLERVGCEGVLVLEVPPGSPAHAAGLRPTHRDIFGDLMLGDIIVGLDGKPVRSYADVYDILDEHRVGDRVRVDVVRDGKTSGLSVTLGERVLGCVEE